MKKLNKILLARWNAARCLFESLKLANAMEPDSVIMYDGSIIENNQLVITGDAVDVIIERCTFNQFTADPDVDHGLYQSITEYEKYVRRSFMLVKEIPW